jgi:energy-converting hydrogenase Eha subunit A
VTAEPSSIPAVQVVSGDPTAEELAALVVALAAALGAPQDTAAPPLRSAWATAARASRPVLAAAPGAWVGSARPH